MLLDDGAEIPYELTQIVVGFESIVVSGVDRKRSGLKSLNTVKRFVSKKKKGVVNIYIFTFFYYCRAVNNNFGGKMQKSKSMEIVKNYID